MDYREKNNRDRITEYRVFYSMSDFAEDSEKIYFSNTNYNALMIVDKATWTVEKTIPFEDEKRAAQNLHLRCVKAAGKVCFLPAEAQHMHVYDIESGKQSVYRIADPREETAVQGFWDYFAYDGKIYFLPGCAGQKLCMWDVGMNTGRTENWWNIPLEDAAVLHGSMDEERFFSFMQGFERLYVTDLSKKTVEEFRLPDEHIKYVTYDGQDFWYVTTDTADIVCWNRERGEVDRYPIKGDVWWEKDLIPCIGIHCAGGHLFLLIYNMTVAYALCVLDREKREVKKIYSINCARGEFAGPELEPNFKRAGNDLLCLLKNAGETVHIVPNTWEVKQHIEDFRSGAQERNYTFDILLDKGALLYEEPGIADLDMLIRHYAGSEE